LRRVRVPARIVRSSERLRAELARVWFGWGDAECARARKRVSEAGQGRRGVRVTASDATKHYLRLWCARFNGRTPSG
jgi:hypothetical protein